MVTQKQAVEEKMFAVGIGASAGGVEALGAFLDHDTGDTPAAFFIAMHLSKNRASHLPEILAHHTSRPVVRAEDGMKVEAGNIYVLLPGQLMRVVDGVLNIAAIGPAERIPTVVDQLFNSLAECYGERAIGVVLSGTGADGALGLKAIKDRGGLTVAQGEDGSAPLFSGMPRSAVAAGVIDLQLPVEEIAGRIASTVTSFGAWKEQEKLGHEQRREQKRKEICDLVRAHTGHDFSGYKSNTFFRRVQRRMDVLRLADVDAYAAYLRQTPDEASLLFRDLLISVTSFFRDKASFTFLEREVIPALFAGKGADQEVRIWVPGCATGEEAYSLGVLALEHVERLGDQAPTVRIFATDIDERALAIARKGRYPSVLLDAVSEERRKRFFVEEHGNLNVQKQLRSICTFSPHNALRDPPFSRIDLVSCRNLLIYLAPEFQDRIFPILHYALRPGGFLFVGIAEGAASYVDLFEPLSKAHRVFRRMASTSEGTALPTLAKTLMPAERRSFGSSMNGTSSHSLRRQVDARILQTYAPAHVVVNMLGEALFYSVRAGSYLEFPTGAPTRQLLVMVRPELRPCLRHALRELAHTQARVEASEVLLPEQGAFRRVQISLEPFENGGTVLCLVVFNDRGPATVRTSDSAGPLEGEVLDHVEQLEGELRETREQLQSTFVEFETTIEELRFTNEELMSVNEELQSSNEELETSKEELQAVNEELETVNSEIGGHVEALNQANADLRGLLESTRIATVFLDRHLAIRSFTQAATEIFTLIPSDRGRLLTDLANQLSDVDLPRDLAHTLQTHNPVERAVSRKDGEHHYLMRILPYGGTAEETLGLVMTFVNVTELVKAEGSQKILIGELNHRVRNMLAVVSAMASQTFMAGDGPDRLAAFIDRLHGMARTYKLLTEANWVHTPLGPLLRQELDAITTVTRYSLAGPDVMLDPKESLALGMVLHELATNALKYGALSGGNGRVTVHWELSDDAPPMLQIHWSESGGPSVTQPTHRGLGSLLIDKQLAYELDGKCQVTFAPEGLRAQLAIPRPDTMHDGAGGAA